MMESNIYNNVYPHDNYDFLGVVDTKKVETFVTRNVRIEGNALFFDLYSITYSYHTKKDLKGHCFHSKSKESEKFVKVTSFQFTEISEEDIPKYRNDYQKAYFLLKDNGRYFITEVDKTVSFVGSEIGTHMCAKLLAECKHFSALPDDQGGCPKVRDVALRLEKYPRILKGYETIHCKNNAFVVLECECYEAVEPKKKISIIKKSELKLSIAQYKYPDIKSLDELKTKLKP